MASTLLFLSADSFQATIWHGGKLGASRYFSNDVNGRENFSEFLQKHRHPTYMLVDVIEEDFRLETVPHLSGSSRKDLLQRKFEQFYRGTIFRQALLLQRQSEGRRDDDMLFSALTNPQRISPWLDALLSNHIPLVGIYSLPNVSSPLIKGIPSDHILLLSWEKDAGLRQTYFNNKRLHFSRLIPISEGSTFSEAVTEETPRTQQYLKSLSLPPPGETLDVYIICDANDKLTLQSSITANNELHYTYLDIHELGKRFKVKNDLASSDATPLLLHLLASKPPSSHYANLEHTHFYLLWQLRRILFGIAAVTAAFSILLSGTEFWQARDYVQQTEPLIAQTNHVKQETLEVQRTFANTSVPAADMKTAVLLARKLNQYTQPPEEILDQLTLTLDKFTQINVNKLGWQTSSADAAPSPYPAEVITFDGSLAGFGSDYRKALNYLDRFQQALTLRGYTVSVVKAPLDISSKGSISGDIQKSDGNPEQFTLKIIWRQKE